MKYIIILTILDKITSVLLHDDALFTDFNKEMVKHRYSEEHCHLMS